MSRSLDLESFFPYKLAKLQALVSENIAQVYTGQFNLSRQQWRVLAILANHAPLSAKDVAIKADLDKMSISRAVNRMIADKLIEKSMNNEDRRSSTLVLTVQGQQLFEQLAPAAKAKEQLILASLNADEQKTLVTLMEKLTLHSAHTIKTKD